MSASATRGWSAVVRAARGALSLLGAFAALGLLPARATAAWPVGFGDRLTIAPSASFVVKATAVRVQKSSNPLELPTVKLYVAGTYRGSAMITQKDGQMVALSAAPIDSSDPDDNVFVAILDGETGAIEKIASAGGPLRDDVRAITVDDDGNVYLAGSFCGGTEPTTLNPWILKPPFAPLPYLYADLVSGAKNNACSMKFTGTEITTYKADLHAGRGVYYQFGVWCDGGDAANKRNFVDWQQDFYVAKLNAALNVQWVRSGGGSLGDTATDIQISPQLCDGGANDGKACQSVADCPGAATTCSKSIWVAGTTRGLSSLNLQANPVPVQAPGVDLFLGNGLDLMCATVPFLYKLKTDGTTAGVNALALGDNDWKDTADKTPRLRFTDSGQSWMTGVPNDRFLSAVNGDRFSVSQIGNFIADLALMPDSSTPGSPPLAYAMVQEGNDCAIRNYAFVPGTKKFTTGSKPVEVIRPAQCGALRVGTAVNPQQPQLYVLGKTGSLSGTRFLRNGAADPDIPDLPASSNLRPGVLFVAGVERAGERWALGADSAAFSDLAANSLAVAEEQYTLFVGGGVNRGISFGGRSLGPGVFGASVGFVAQSASYGAWPTDQTWVVGTPLEPPPGANIDTALGPDPTGLKPADAFYWSVKNQKLYPIKATTAPAQVIWRKMAGSGPVQSRNIVWPADAAARIHIAGAPVTVEPSGNYTVETRPLDRLSTQKVFQQQVPDYTVFIYHGPNDDVLEVVHTVTPPTTPLAGGACSIGSAIPVPAPPLHDDPSGKNGWVIDGAARYAECGSAACTGADRIYDRATRTGRIIPVNTWDAAPAGPHLDVAYYKNNSLGVAWPSEVRRYDCTWPARADVVAVGSERGSTAGTCADDSPCHQATDCGSSQAAICVDAELTFRCGLSSRPCVTNADCSSLFDVCAPIGPPVKRCVNGPQRQCATNDDCRACLPQEDLDPAVFKNSGVYHQPDPTKAGFNPNEEHALVDTNVLYALRRDLNQKYGYSAPYVLLKYKDGGEWRFKPYRVVDADFASAEPQVTVGNRVPLPKPLNNLGACADSCAPTGEDCEADADACGGLCYEPGAKHLCEGGTNAGTVCTKDADCAGGGTCSGGYFSYALFRDWRNNLYARAQGPIQAKLSYPLQGDFFLEKVCRGGMKAGTACSLDADCGMGATCGQQVNDCVRWLVRKGCDGGANAGRACASDGDCPSGTCAESQKAFTYHANWPKKFGLQRTLDAPPTLTVGETLVDPKRQMPAIRTQAAVEVAFETGDPTGAASEGKPQNEPASLVRLIDITTPRKATLAALPDDIIAEDRGNGDFVLIAGLAGAKPLSPSLQARMRFDRNAGLLMFLPIFDPGLGDPLLLPNIMSAAERDDLLELSAATQWQTAVKDLYAESRNPNHVPLETGEPADAYKGGFAVACSLDPSTICDPKKVPDPCAPTRGTCSLVRPAKLASGGAVTAGKAEGTGWTTLVFNNAPGITSPIDMQVIQVGCDTTAPPEARQVPYQGQLRVIAPDNVFDEQVNVRHNADFGGDPNALAFEWWYTPKETACENIPVPGRGPVAWTKIPGTGPEVRFPLNGDPVATLADTCVVARYTGYRNSQGAALCDNVSTPSQWAGAPLGPDQFRDPKAQLVPGWISRVTRRINPFDQKFTDFRKNGVDTLSSAVANAGARAEGPIALNPDALDGVRLIPLYETVLGRGRGLSIDDGLDVAAVNQKLLDVAGRVNELYMLLGNEAFADAQDPTIGFTTAGVIPGSSISGSLASSIHAFQDQTGGPTSLLQEELALLRGVDKPGGASPTYNRLLWNLTNNPAGGQLAYVQNYNITDQNMDGVTNEEDAKILFPQGHGDAWGHYLTAIQGYYTLLRHPKFTWIPRSDSVSVGDKEVQIDYGDERRFATAAAARARTGAQIVDLTYRRDWVDSPNADRPPREQGPGWLGYTDPDTNRGFGVFEWAERAGQGAYFDWVVANALLPPHSNKPAGIEKIDRTTVPELREIVSQAGEVTAQLDIADQGLNPIGLPKDIVPFDITPSEIDPASGPSKSHFEQIADRATKALRNAIAVFDRANDTKVLLRRTQDMAADLAQNVADQERESNTRLLEIFGSPYSGDPTYPPNYRGPDLYNWNVLEQSELTGDRGTLPSQNPKDFKLTVKLPDTTDCGENREGTCALDRETRLQFDGDGNLKFKPGEVLLQVQTSTVGSGRIKPAGWGTRAQPGELQQVASELLQTRAQFERAIAEYSALIYDIDCLTATLEGQRRFATEKLFIQNVAAGTRSGLAAAILVAKGVEVNLRRKAGQVDSAITAAIEGLPKVVGVSSDTTFLARNALTIAKAAARSGFDTAADVAEAAQLGFEQAADRVTEYADIKLSGLEEDLATYNIRGELGQKVAREPVLRLQALELQERLRAAGDKLRATAAKGVAEIDKLEAFRKKTANKVTQARYNDMTFRVFLNDALQKYKAQFDVAARYVYLAATAYDYDTNLGAVHTEASPGRGFLTDIVKERVLGQVVNGEPVDDSKVAGLAGKLARMKREYVDLKTKLSFNNPYTQTNRFSLRRELFRVLDGSDAQWRKALADSYVADLWAVPEYRRFAEPSRAEASGPLPGLVIPFASTVTSGLNFFGKPRGGFDSAFDSTYFSTRVRRLGVWFANYNANTGENGLGPTPFAYLIPAGADVLRPPISGDFKTRNWTILDQGVPAPSGTEKVDDRTWSPLRDTIGSYGAIRKFPSFRAFHDSGAYLGTSLAPAPPATSSAEITSSSRAIGRSVANTRWLIIIPADGFGGNSPAEFRRLVFRFIYGKTSGGGGSIVDPDGQAHDGNGIKDILLYFQTYAYSGSIK